MAKIEDLKYELLSGELNDYDLNFKIIIVGDSGVGKTSLVMKGTQDYF